MRKKEHIHTHALLAEITQHLIETEAMPVERLSGYHELGTSPSSIQKSKQNHREAIMILSSAIEPCLKEIPTDSHEQSVNR